MTTASPMLNREQRCIIRRVTRRLGTVQQQTIGGFAGMGKSTHLCALADALPDFAVCAFTDRTASVSRDRGVRTAGTIHGAIYYAVAQTDGRVTFRLRSHNEIAYRGILIDVATMVGRDLAQHLLSFCCPSCSSAITVSHAMFEDCWARVVLGVRVRNWQWDTLVNAHLLDHRPNIGSIKFQAFVRLGVPEWDGHIKPFLRPRGGGGSDLNRVADVEIGQLLLYGGLDSLYEYLVSDLQMAEAEAFRCTR